MKIRATLFAVMLLAPTPAFAHPGHDQHMTMTTVGLWAALALVNLVLLIPLYRLRERDRPAQQVRVRARAWPASLALTLAAFGVFPSPASGRGDRIT